MRITKADLVPTEANLLDDYATWTELVEACEAFEASVNGREHWVARRGPDEMLARGTHLVAPAVPPPYYHQLLGWARAQGNVVEFGVEGTGSYGSGWPGSCAGAG